MKKLNVFLVALMVAVLGVGIAFAAAVTYTTPQAGSYNLHQPLHNGEAASVSVCYEAVALATTLDTIQMVKVPALARVTDVILVTDDLDGGTTLALSVGYGVDPNYFISSDTTARTGGLVRSNLATALPLDFTSADTIDVQATVPTDTGAAGTVCLTVMYTTK